MLTFNEPARRAADGCEDNAKNWPSVKYNEILKRTPSTELSGSLNVHMRMGENTKQPTKPAHGALVTDRSINAGKHQILGRTASAPVAIPRNRNAKSQRKREVTRVASASGASGLSPGGMHRIIYEREFLLECRQSPLSLTPPTDLPKIPGATAPRERQPRRKQLEKTDSNVSTSSTASCTSVTSNESSEETKPTES